MDFKHIDFCSCTTKPDGTISYRDDACESFNDGYQAGLAEGEARATRAIVADLRSDGPVTLDGEDHLFPKARRAFADRYEAGQHLAAKADGEK